MRRSSQGSLMDTWILARILAGLLDPYEDFLRYKDPMWLCGSSRDPFWQWKSLLATKNLSGYCTRFLARNQAALAIVFHWNWSKSMLFCFVSKGSTNNTLFLSSLYRLANMQLLEFKSHNINFNTRLALIPKITKLTHRTSLFLKVVVYTCFS